MSGELTVRCECGREFVVLAYAVPADEVADILRDRALELIAGAPDTYTRSEVASMLGCRRRTGLAVVGRLMAEGVVGPNHKRARLSVQDGAEDAPEGTRASQEPSAHA